MLSWSKWPRPSQWIASKGNLTNTYPWITIYLVNQLPDACSIIYLLLSLLHNSKYFLSLFLLSPFLSLFIQFGLLTLSASPINLFVYHFMKRSFSISNRILSFLFLRLQPTKLSPGNVVGVDIQKPYRIETPNLSISGFSTHFGEVPNIFPKFSITVYPKRIKKFSQNKILFWVHFPMFEDSFSHKTYKSTNNYQTNEN